MAAGYKYSPSKLIKFVGFVCKYIPRGKGAVARFFGKLLSGFLNNKYISTRYGAKMVVDSLNVDFYATMYRWGDSWEHWIFDTAHWLLPEDGIFYDIGGNVGYMTIEMLQRKPDIKAVCFEPIPNLAKTINESISLNEFSDRAKVYEYGLSDKHGVVGSLMIPAHQGHSSLEKNTLSVNTKSIDIQLVTLDKICQEKSLPLPDLIKIDIEGHEYKALVGAKKTLEKSKPHVLFEASNNGEFKKIKLLLSSFAEYRYFYAIGSYRELKELASNEAIDNKIDVIAVNITHSNLPNDLVRQL